MEIINKTLDEPYGFIYITTNLINGKRYIGQKKLNSHRDNQSYLGSGVGITKAIKKYGEENFYKEIVDWGYNKEELDLKEYEWIKNLDAVKSEDYYNLIDGGDATTNKQKQKIYSPTLDIIFDSMSEASKICHVAVKTIKKIANGSRKVKSTKIKFKFYTDGDYEKWIEEGICFCRCCGGRIKKTKNKNRYRYCNYCKKNNQEKIKMLNKELKDKGINNHLNSGITRGKQKN